MRHWIVVLILTLASCRSAPIERAAMSPIGIGQSSSQVRAVIRASLATGEWTILGEQDGSIYATMGTVPTHGWVINIRVDYDKDKYAIQYVNSIGMDYDPRSGTIHENYNRRVRSLRNMIDSGLSGLPPQATEVAAPSEPQPSAAPPAPRSGGTGSGFYVTSDGYLVTNAHVVSGCTSVVTALNEKLDVRAVDEVSDLALLKLAQGVSPAYARLRGDRGVRLAETVMVLGFPLFEMVSTDMNATIGNVSALTGIGGDRGRFQISAAVQPGNSGGPVIDLSGNVIGVVVSRLREGAMLERTGALPQNVNFAISLGTLQAFLDAEGVDYKASPVGEARDQASLATEGRRYTALVRCLVN